MNDAARQRVADARRALEAAQDESDLQWRILGEKIDRSMDPSIGGPWPTSADYDVWMAARAEVDRLSDEFEQAMDAVRPR